MTQQSEIIGNKSYIPTLNAGFVGLIDHMGDDSSIVQAARVSYGKGTKKVSEDRGLIRYLVRHSHTTPLEMVEFKFHCKMPIFVARQWIRHRTACISGNSSLWFDEPAAVKKGNRKRRNITIKDLYQKWHNQLPMAHNQYPIKNMYLRSLNEDTNELMYTTIKDIWKTGIKKVYEITLENGYKIKTSKDHLFFTSEGWKKLEEFTNITNNICAWKDSIKLISNGNVLYQNKDWLKQKYHTEELPIKDIAELSNCSYHTIRKWLAKHELTLPGRGQFKKNSVPWNIGLTYNMNLSEDQRQKRQEVAKENARRGEDSNFWKGGISSDRENIGRWTTQVAAKQVFLRDKYECKITGNKNNLEAHHIDPVWNNKEKAYELSNLITLCKEAHRKIHQLNLDLVFLDYVEQGNDISKFFEKYNTKIELDKPKGSSKLVIGKQSSIASVTYIGEEETYDIEVTGPYHNFICEGFTVHNSVNEYSGRYSEMSEDMFVPELHTIKPQSDSNKQGRGGEYPLGHREMIRDAINAENQRDQSVYQSLLSENLSKEMARGVLSVNNYTEWYWKIDLHNLLHFLKLRMDAHAQYEIRVFADAMYELIKPIVPIACEAFEDFVFDPEDRTYQSYKLSKQELNALRAYIAEDEKAFEYFETVQDMSKRELDEFKKKFRLD